MSNRNEDSYEHFMTLVGYHKEQFDKFEDRFDNYQKMKYYQAKANEAKANEAKAKEEAEALKATAQP